MGEQARTKDTPSESMTLQVEASLNDGQDKLEMDIITANTVQDIAAINTT